MARAVEWAQQQPKYLKLVGHGIRATVSVSLPRGGVEIVAEGLDGRQTTIEIPAGNVPALMAWLKENY